MSMLTPPGMGGKYRIKGDRYPRMRPPRRRHRFVLAAVAGVLALGLVGWGTLQLIDVFSGGDRASAAAGHGGAGGKGCAADAKDQARQKKQAERQRRAAAKLPKPGDITVNVLNATKRSGLAQRTADELKKRGFKVGKVANAPASLDGKVKSSGVLLGAPGEETTARQKVLGTQLKGADTRYDDRKGEDVDLVIGDDFTKLVKKKDAEAAVKALAEPSPAPSRTHCAAH